MSSIAHILHQAERRLTASPTARLDALVLLEFTSGRDRTWLMAHEDEELSAQTIARFLKLIERRTAHEPVAYITGSKEFYGLDFKVTPDVLIPRPETESLVGLAIQLTPAAGTLCDVGTGSAAIAIAVAKQRPDLHITAVDISPAALRIARKNIGYHNVSGRVNIAKSDLLTAAEDSFDIITANLPYLPSTYNGSAKLPLQGVTLQSRSAGLRWEPRTALDGGNDGLEIYRRLLATVSTYLKPNGHIILEAEPEQHGKLGYIADDAGLKMTIQRGLAMVLRMK